MSCTSDFGRYQHVAGSVAIPPLGDGFKELAAAVWGSWVILTTLYYSVAQSLSEDAAEHVKEASVTPR